MYSLVKEWEEPNLARGRISPYEANRKPIWENSMMAVKWGKGARRVRAYGEQMWTVKRKKEAQIWWEDGGLGPSSQS